MDIIDGDALIDGIKLGCFVPLRNDLCRVTPSPTILARYINKTDLIVGVICSRIAVPGLDPCGMNANTLRTDKPVDYGGPRQPPVLMVRMGGYWFNHCECGVMMHGDASGGDKDIMLVVYDDVECGAITRRHLLKRAVFCTAVYGTPKRLVKQLPHLVSGLVICCHCRDAVLGGNRWRIESCGGEVEALLRLIIAGLLESGVCQRMCEYEIIGVTPHVYRGKFAV